MLRATNVAAHRISDGFALNKLFGVGSNEQFLVSAYNGNSNFAVGCGNHLILAEVHIILFLVELYAEVFKSLERIATHGMLMFSHSCGENYGIKSAHGVCVCSYILAYAVAIGIACEQSAAVAGMNGIVEFAHIARNSGNAQHARFFIDEFGSLFDVEVQMLHEKENSHGIDIAGACSHNKTCERSETH